MRTGKGVLIYDKMGTILKLAGGDKKPDETLPTISVSSQYAHNTHYQYELPDHSCNIITL